MTVSLRMCRPRELWATAMSVLMEVRRVRPHWCPLREHLPLDSLSQGTDTQPPKQQEALCSADQWTTHQHARSGAVAITIFKYMNHILDKGKLACKLRVFHYNVSYNWSNCMDLFLYYYFILIQEYLSEPRWSIWTWEEPPLYKSKLPRDITGPGAGDTKQWRDRPWDLERLWGALAQNNFYGNWYLIQTWHCDLGVSFCNICLLCLAARGEVWHFLLQIMLVRSLLFDMILYCPTLGVV